MVRAVIFDCFGVIITDALKLVVDELETRDPQAARDIVDIIHANNRGIIVPAESNRQIAAILGVSVEAWRERIEQGEVKDEHLLRYLSELRERGYKTALLSNIGKQSLHRRFSDHELETHFDAVIASGEIGYVKPEPEIYHHASRQLGVTPEECLFVDDRERHCAGAQAVGMQTVLYQDFAQAKKEIERLLANPKD
jgi:putative hydrolase of the HAD superfamily